MVGTERWNGLDVYAAGFGTFSNEPLNIRCVPIQTEARSAAARGARALALPITHRFGIPLVSTVSKETIAKKGYYSQIGQDILLDQHIFRQKTAGIFVDVGAHDGVTFSNTAFFERQREWTGLCVEANPDVYPRLVSSRTASCVHAAVGATDGGTVPFRAISGPADTLSGVDASYGWRHARRATRELDVQGGTLRHESVRMRRLDSLLSEAAIERVDLLSIDVEGGERGVLDSLDLRRFHVHAVIIENNYRSWNLAKRLYRQDYQPVARIGQDELYLARPIRLA